VQAAPFFDRLVFSKIKARLGGRVTLILSGGAPLAPHVEEFLKARARRRRSNLPPCARWSGFREPGQGDEGVPDLPWCDVRASHCAKCDCEVALGLGSLPLKQGARRGLLPHLRLTSRGCGARWRCARRSSRAMA